MIFAKNRRFITVDEALEKIGEFTTDEEYCNLVFMLLKKPVARVRKVLRKWAVAHSNEEIKNIGKSI